MTATNPLCYSNFILSALVLILCCSPTKPQSHDADTPHAGMHKIASAGKSFMQGANDTPVVSEDEKPPMTSAFAYNYWIDTTEVTQKEYFDVTGRQPVKDTSPYGVGDRNPVYNVSWFDAILFCNEKSKNETLDTVYTYVGIPETQSGAVYALPGLRIRYNCDGYRLPTEAEWEFAAREGSSQIPFPHLKDSSVAQTYAWYASNASGHTHPAATLQSNVLGLYDMAGNVFEWTEDWKGFYSVSGITNSVGALQPDNSNERVIKGGSFEHGFTNLRPSRRSATYETTPSTASEYVGFRCARGKIPNPAYISPEIASVSTNPADLAVTTVHPFLGTYHARIVFVNVTQTLRTLCFIDFFKSNPAMYEFKDCTNVYVPVLSPNGKYVTFGTRNIGLSGSGNIYVRCLDSLSAPPVKLPSDSAFMPRWWVDPAIQDTFLIYTNSAIDNTSALWTTTRTILQKMAGGSPSGTPQELISDGSFHDGRSTDGKYIVTGFRQLIMRSLSNNEDRRLFVYPQNGKGPDESSQVCNVSISPEGADDDQCLFLDFGCSSQSSLTGTSYGLHEYLFKADFSGRTIAWYKCPEGEQSWDCCQWSNRARFAVACGCNSSGETHAIYAINFQNSTNCKIVEGVDLRQPSLWVRSDEPVNPDSLNLDSLGNYNDPPVNFVQQQVSGRLQPFWRKHDEMKIVFVGTSHTVFGIDPRYFTSANVYNMAIGGGDYAAVKTIVLDYVLNHCPSIKLIGCDMIVGYMGLKGMDRTWSQWSASSKGYNYDKNHRFWKTRLPKNFTELVTNVPYVTDTSFAIDTLGSVHAPCLGWRGDNPSSAGVDFTIEDTVYKENYSMLKRLIQLCADRHIHFLLMIIPESPYYRNSNVYGAYGPSMETGKAVVAQLKALQDSIPYYHFYDANLDGNHDYSDNEAYNSDHLCSLGAQKLSTRVDSVVHAILNH